MICELICEGAWAIMVSEVEERALLADGIV